MTARAQRGARALALVLTVLLGGCELLDRSLEVSPAPRAEGAVELGVGDLTLRLEPCIVLRGLAPERLQLTAPSGVEELPPERPRVYAEVPVKSGAIPTGEAREVGLAVLRLSEPLERDEDRVYRNHDLELTLEKVEGGRAHGRLAGRVEDLLHGRSHELRARFECAADL